MTIHRRSLIFRFRYASRVKLITNDAQKNSENKEIARLKGVSISMYMVVSNRPLLPVPIERFLISNLFRIVSFCFQPVPLVNKKRFLFFFQIIAKLKKGEAVDDAEVDESTQVSWKNKRAFCIFLTIEVYLSRTPFLSRHG